MSFSATTKNELARIIPEKRCCQKAELAALIRMDGVIQISTGNRVTLNINTENAAVARKIFTMLKNLFNIHTEVLMRKGIRLKKHNSYLVRVAGPGKVQTILKAIGVLDLEGDLAEGIYDEFLAKECCRRAYLRGVFLGGGSVSDPEGDYHLEIITNDAKHAEAICRLIRRYKLPAKVGSRKNWQVVYLKGSEAIVALLNIIGAHSALLNFENVRIVKDMRNQVNRLVNCETANLNKTVNAAVRQLESIRFVANTLGMDKLPAGLREVAEARLRYPEVSLKELGELMDPPVGKSGVNHRIRKLEKLAEKLRERVNSI
ncbi:MAG: DNA-binding protein WhiA [Clostridia bacterium]|nr:DNA-binding protein WhiA [Clostridia bacterium]